jgi:hypothetical protein
MKRELSARQESPPKSKYETLYSPFLRHLSEILPLELFDLILSFCNIIEHYVLQFVCKYTYDRISYIVSMNGNSSRNYFTRNFTRVRYPESAGAIIEAIEGGYLFILIWMRELFPKFLLIPNNIYCARAARFSNLEILKWLIREGCLCDENICQGAAEGGHLELLKWAKDNQCPWNHTVCALAAEKGHLEILKWARENGCPWTALVCRSAAEKGYFDILKWARENGCPWDEYTCYGASMVGHFEALRAALARNVEMSQREWMSFG